MLELIDDACGEVDNGETFGDVGIVNTVFVESPSC